MPIDHDATDVGLVTADAAGDADAEPAGQDGLESPDAAATDAATTDAGHFDAGDAVAADAVAEVAGPGDTAAADSAPADALTTDALTADAAQVDVPTANADGDAGPILPDASDSAATDTATWDGATTDTVGPDQVGDQSAGSPDAAADAAPDSASDTKADVADTAAPADVADVAAPADVAPPFDAAADAGADTGPPAPVLLAPCDNDADCLGTGSGQRCDPTLHACVACLTSADCPTGGLCQQQSCVVSQTCKGNGDCAAPMSVCDKAIGVCAPCASDADCPGQKCRDHTCVAVKLCKASKDCPGAVCLGAVGECAACYDSSDCGPGTACIGNACKPLLCLAPACAGGKSFLCKGDGGGYSAGKPCDDQNACTAGDSCDAGLCQLGQLIDCSDSNPCTTDSCAADAGCQQVPGSGACDDGDACTVQDQCAGGSCSGNPLGCDDNNPCTLDSCSAGQCQHIGAAGTCDDGNACTTGDGCALGTCKGKTAVCNDGNPCSQDTCDKLEGCQSTPILAAPCDDGNGCTVADTCLGGVCVGIGTPCSDNNPCTDDGCGGGGCVHTPNQKPCDDNDFCTSGDVCSAGACKGTVATCDDGDPCSNDACLSVGCQHLPNTATCDDANPCTVSDVCASGFCGGKPKDCSDGNDCTADACDAGTCVHAAVADGSGCGGVGSCSLCKAGKCEANSVAGFEKTYGGAGLERLYATVAAPSGGWLAAGQTASKGIGTDDGWLVRLDASGKVLWEKTFGGYGADALTELAALSNGNYALLGTNNSQGNGAQIWFLVVDGSGNPVAGTEKVFGSHWTDTGRALVANSGGVLIAGQRQNYAVATNQVYGWVAQLDVAGTKVWEQDLTNYSDLAGLAIAGDQYIVLGTGTTAAGNADLMLQRRTAANQVVWQATAGGMANDVAQVLLKLADGSLVIAGRQGPNASDALLIARFDTQGKLLWQTTDASLAGDLNAAIAAGSTVVLAGAVRSSSQWDGRLVGLALANGALLWSHTAPYSANYDDTLWGGALSGGALGWVGSAYTTGTASVDGWLLVTTDQGKIDCACENTCSDGNLCTVDLCYLGICKSKTGSAGTFCFTSKPDPGKCDASGDCKNSCGNKACDPGENSSNCAADCKSPAASPCDLYCGSSNPTYGCRCDSGCKISGTCCQPSGLAGAACTGSTCSLCQ
ncbi:MAG: hypothetical protein HY902_17425 [Deltaproteobacteria bacterium]|nr:hypothetical protein [Deltaproteobacteria bacterium]